MSANKNEIISANKNEFMSKVIILYIQHFKLRLDKVTELGNFLLEFVKDV